MIRHYRFLMLTCVIVMLISLSACSDVQNQKKKTTQNIQGATITLTVNARSTTNGTTTSKTLDGSIEKKVTKNLTRILVNGTGASDAFSDTARAQSAADFPDNRQAKKNVATVVYSYMAGDKDENSIVVAEVTQKLTPKTGRATEKTGKVFFTPGGTVIGFEFSPAQEVGTETTAKVSS